MTYWDDFQTRCNISPQTQFANQQQQKITDTFSLASDVISVLLNGSPITVRLESESNGNSSEGIDQNKDNIKKIIFSLLTQVINIGDIFTFNGFDWIVISTNKLSMLQNSCKVKRCNNQLKWMDSTKTLQTYSCIVETLSTKREETKDYKTVIVEYGKFLVTVPYNSNTKQIYAGQRFIFNNIAYRVIYPDSVTNVINGVGNLLLVLDTDQVGSNDNLALGVADYYSNQHNYQIVILNGASITFQQGSTLQLNVKVTDNSVNIISPVVTYSSSNTSIATVNSTGLATGVAIGSATITATSNSVSTTISVTISSSALNNYTVDISGSSFMTINTSQNYTCAFKNNGVITGDTATLWWLTADDGISATTLATITYTGNSCTVKANSSVTGYVRLFVKNASNTQNYLRIQVKSLW